MDDLDQDYSCPRGEGEYCILGLIGACAFGPECEHTGKTRAEKEEIWQQHHEKQCAEMAASGVEMSNRKRAASDPEE